MVNINYSFVIPHHNTPSLLQRLVDTIPLREDIEIIIVDDNSSDEKKASVTRPDVRTIFIDKYHTKGAGHARNEGMKVANGRWLLFADSDDFYLPGFIDILDDYKDSDLDMVFYNIESVDSNSLQPEPHNRAFIHRKLISDYISNHENADNLLYLGFGPWRKMLRTDFVKKYGLFFEEIPKDNDHMFALLTSYFAKKWKVEQRSVYSLIYYSGSITYSSMTKEKCLAHFNTLRRRAEFYKYIGHPEWNKRCVRGRFFQSGLLWCYLLLKQKRIFDSVKAFIIYLLYFYKIEKGKNYYVQLAESIKQKLLL